MTTPSGAGLLACGTAVLLAGLVYLNALDNPFVYDDVPSVVENRSIVPPVNARAVILQNVSRPLVNVTYVIDRAIWGPAPFGFHLTSVLLHMVNVALLFVFTQGVVRDRRPGGTTEGLPRRARIAGFAAASLFAVHPMMSQAVGYISGRSDVLAGTFMLVALVAVRRWMNTDRLRWLAAALIAVFLALGSKETAIVLPVLFVYYILFVRDDSAMSRRKHMLMLCAPLVAIAIVGASVRLGLFVFVEYAGTVGWQWRFALTEIDVFTRYLAMMIAPGGQTVFHAVPATIAFSDPRAIVAMATSALCLGLIVVAAFRRSVAGFGLTWFTVMLLPSALLVLLNRGEPMAEHRVYFASAGLFLAAGHAAGAISVAVTAARRVTRLALRVAGVVVLASLAGRTVVRNVVWSSPVLLWTEAAERAPDHWLPALVLGESFHDAGRHEEAIDAFRAAARTGPAVPAIYEHLGLCLLETRRFAEATETFSTLATVAPRSAAAPNGHAMTAFLQGDVETARRGFLAALDLEPRSVEARRGLVLIEELPGGSSAEAFRRCEEIRLLAPGAPGVDACIERHRAAAAP